MFEIFDSSLASLCECFDPAVVKIADIAPDLVPRGGPLCKKSKSNALHNTAYKELSSYHHF